MSNKALLPTPAGTEGVLGHGLFEQCLAVGVELAVLLDLAVGHAGVGLETTAGEAMGLAVAGGDDLLAHPVAALACPLVAQLAIGHARDFDGSRWWVLLAICATLPLRSHGLASSPKPQAALSP